MTALTILTLLLAGPPPRIPLERIGRLDHPPIREASGLVKSRRYPGIYWVHNDSGNAPSLFAVRGNGSLVREFTVAAPNVDWEDIATDDQGRLYLGDIGNNGGLLPLRAIYQIDEPDPSREAPGPLKVRAASYYRFPAGGRFDAEALVIDGDRALVVAKSLDGRAAEVYAIPIEPPAPLLRPALPERVGALTGFTPAVTGADLTADGKRLVVCSLETIGVFEKGAKGTWNPIARKRFDSGDQVEAVAWDGDDVLLAGEGRGVFRIRSAVWRGAAPRPPRP